MKEKNLKNKALFLDRDGVINIDYGHVSKIKKFDLIKDIDTLVIEAISRDYKIIVITNQAGIGKGLYSLEDFHILNTHMKSVFKSKKCNIDAVYFCPYHPKDGIGHYLKDSFDRKPNPGMLLGAEDDFNIDMNKSIFIGDKLSDVNAGMAASVRTNILFNEYKRAIDLPQNCEEIFTLSEAINYL